MHVDSYYTLDRACNTKETGPIYPQVQKMKPGYDDKKSNSIYSYLKKSITDFSDEAPDLDSFILHRYAKPTDMVSNAITDGHGFFLSKRLKSVLEKHHLPPHKFYSAKVIHNGKPIEDYFWLHIISDLTEFVDYGKSVFFMYQRNQDSNKPIKITSKEDFSKKEKQAKEANIGTYTEIRSEEIHLQQLPETELDLMQVGMFDFNFYISKRLNDALISNNITGCDIKQTDRIVMKQ